MKYHAVIFFWCFTLSLFCFGYSADLYEIKNDNEHFTVFLYINLYSPTSGSKEKKTYIHMNTVKKQQQKQKNREQVYELKCCQLNKAYICSL